MKCSIRKFTVMLSAMLTVVMFTAAYLPVSASDAKLPEPVFSMNDSLDRIAGEYTEKTVNGIKGVFLNGVSGLRYDGFEMDLAKPFTVSFSVQIDQYKSGFAVITAVNPKASGHIEIYLQDGTIMFYAPDVNNGAPVSSSISVMDGALHNVVCSYDGAKFCYYDNGNKVNEWDVTGAVADIGATVLSIGDLNEGGMPLSGFIGDLRYFDSILSDEQVASMSASADDGKDDDNIVVEKEPKLLASLAENGITVENGGTEDGLIGSFVHNIGDNFTISAWLNTTGSEIQVLFAKDVKASDGHFEVYLESNGELAFYAPMIANNNAVRSGVIVNDGKTHSFAITYDGSKMIFYVDGASVNTVEVTGQIANKTSAFRIGMLLENQFGYTGTIGNIRLYNYALGEAEAKSLSTGGGQTPANPDKPDTPDTPPTGDAPVWACISCVLMLAAGAAALCKMKRVS